jgi:hypothetical protein
MANVISQVLYTCISFYLIQLFIGLCILCTTEIRFYDYGLRGIEFASTHAIITFHTAIRPYRYQDAFNTTLCNDAC